MRADDPAGGMVQFHRRAQEAANLRHVAELRNNKTVPIRAGLLVLQPTVYHRGLGFAMQPRYKHNTTRGGATVHPSPGFPRKS